MQAQVKSHVLRKMGTNREHSEYRDIKMHLRHILYLVLSLNLLFRWRSAIMASTSHRHSAFRPYMVQLVWGSPIKQERQDIDTDRSFLNVFEFLGWSKGYSLV